MALDGNGNVYVTGEFEGTATFGPFSLSSNGNSPDIFVAKLDAEGNWLWVIEAGGWNIDRVQAIATDDNGNSCITGMFNQTATFGPFSLTSTGEMCPDIFIAKLDAEGNWQWAIQAEGEDSACGYGITIDDNGNCYFTGDFYTTTTFGPFTLTSTGYSTDSFVAKLDSNGNWLWVTQISGSYSETGKAIVTDNNGYCIVTGEFQGTSVFGEFSITGNGLSHDIFVAKYGYYLTDFVADITEGYPPLTVNFTDLSSINSTYWEWDFNYDGVVDSYEQNPTFIYNQSGIYTVAFSASDGSNTGVEIKVDYITLVEGFTANFEGHPISGIFPLEVQFTDLTLINPITWEWDFDDDGTVDSYEQNPFHTYIEPGNYTVTLTTSDGIDTDIETKEDYISVTTANNCQIFPMTRLYPTTQTPSIHPQQSNLILSRTQKQKSRSSI